MEKAGGLVVVEAVEVAHLIIRQEQVEALDQVIRTEVELTELEIDFGA